MISTLSRDPAIEEWHRHLSTCCSVWRVGFVDLRWWEEDHSIVSLGTAAKCIDMLWRLARRIRREPFDRQHVTINRKLTIAQCALFWCGINKEPGKNNPIALHSIRPFDSPAHFLIAFKHGSDLRLFEDQKPFLRWPWTGRIHHEIPHTY